MGGDGQFVCAISNVFHPVYFCKLPSFPPLVLVGSFGSVHSNFSSSSFRRTHLKIAHSPSSLGTHLLAIVYHYWNVMQDIRFYIEQLKIAQNTDLVSHVTQCLVNFQQRMRPVYSLRGMPAPFPPLSRVRSTSTRSRRDAACSIHACSFQFLLVKIRM